MEDDKSGTSGEANWQKEMDLDWAHTLETEKPHYQTGINVDLPGKRRCGRPRNTQRRNLESEMKKEGHGWMKLKRVAPNGKQWKLIVDRWPMLWV